MRCFNCHKNFDYDKYYGICPKCGCFNQRETQEERHEDLHDRFGDDSDHREAREHDQPHSFSSYPNVSRETFGDAQSSGSIPVYEQEKTKRRGSGFLAVSIAVLILGLVFLISGSLVHTIGNSPSGTEDNSLQFLSHEAGEDFVFQQGSLKVAEAKRLADQNSLPGLLEGMTLIAVHVTGQSDGQYEYYNKVAVPYLEIDGTYRRALSAYDFEPYGQLLDAYPVLDEYALMEGDACDGWYGFLAEDDVTDIRIWLDEYDGSDWDGGKLLAAHYVDLVIEETSSDEGGVADGQ